MHIPKLKWNFLMHIPKLKEGFLMHIPKLKEGFLVTQMVKNLPAMQETWVPSLGGEDPLEEGMATHSNILAWRIQMDRGAWWMTVHGVTESDTTE